MPQDPADARGTVVLTVLKRQVVGVFGDEHLRDQSVGANSCPGTGRRSTLVLRPPNQQGRSPSAYAEMSPGVGERCGCHGIEVEIAGATVRIAQDASAAQIAAVIRALKAPL